MSGHDWKMSTHPTHAGPVSLLTPGEVEWGAAVVAQASCEGDDERAHSLEDRLALHVFLMMAEDRIAAPEPIARTMLWLKRLDFARWCA